MTNSEMLDGLKQFVDAVEHDRKAVADLQARLSQAEKVIEASRCIRHWHDAMSDGSGMVVSAEAVHKLWNELESYDKLKGKS